jgi:hypothetical protein
MKYLKQHHEWNTRWRSAINEISVGNPIPYIFYPASSGNLIHHAYHVAQFEEKTKYKIQDMEFVFEFGGGYGSMCRLFHNLGFRGKYVIFDLPSFSALQTYYLKTGGFPVQTVAEAANKMFVATWSISESPAKIREAVLSLVPGFQSFLIAYQDRFGEVDNVKYFEDWRKTVKNVAWNNWRINHISGSSYLVGTRNGERQ